MVDTPPHDHSSYDSGDATGHGAATGMAGWQKVVGVTGLVTLVGLGILLLTSGGHGPGRHGSSALPHGDDHEGNTAPIAGASNLAISARNLTFTPDRIELTDGEPLNVTLTSVDIAHDLVVDEIGFHLAADRNESVTGGLLFLAPGDYIGYCSVRGHREAGMELVIVVTPSEGDAEHTPVSH